MATEEKSDSNHTKLIELVLGVHSACYDLSTVQDEPYCIDIPISSQIARWNIKTKERINTFYLHEALISSIQNYNNQFIATCGYDTMLKIWDKNYNLLCQTVASIKNEPVSRIDWSKDGKQLIVQIKSNESTYKDCTISLYNLDYNAKDDRYSLQLLSTKIEGYRYALFNKHNQILAFNTDPNIIELLSQNKLLFIGSFTNAMNRTWTAAIAINESGTMLAIATSNKEIFIINAVTLQLINIIKHTDLSPNLWCIAWNINHENEIIFSPKNGVIELWDVVKCECKYKYKSANEFIYVLQQIKLNDNDDYNYLYCVSSDSVYLQCMKAEEKEQKQQTETLQYHSITCCGVDLSFNNEGKCEYIAVGDLGCSLCIWSHDTDINYNKCKPLMRKSCVMSIRSIKWIPNTNIIFIGCLDGSLCLYKFDNNENENNSVLPVIFNCDSGITCIGYKYQYEATCNQYKGFEEDDDIIISVGSNGGEIFTFQFSKTDQYKTKLLNRFMAHPAVNSDDEEYKKQFGSIHKAADIWSCVYSPCGRYLATASEDQSTKIWDTGNGYKYLKTLTGHKSAVTCIDWTFVKGGNELFATCADDRTVMIWQPKEWNLLHIFSPSNVLGWFTFTYLRFQRDGDLLICGTENGYICVFDVAKMVQLYTKCFHRGSIEGLECNKNGLFVSIASDCTIVVQQTNRLNNENNASKSLL